MHSSLKKSIFTAFLIRYMAQRLTQQWLSGTAITFRKRIHAHSNLKHLSLTWHRMVLWRRSAVSRSCCHVSPTSISAIFHHNLRLKRTIYTEPGTVLVIHFIYLLKKQRVSSKILFNSFLPAILSWDLLNHQLRTRNSQILFWKKCTKNV